MKTAFVTGGAGFLGLNLVWELVDRGVDVTTFDLSDSHAGLVEKMGARFVQGDITDPGACNRALPKNMDAVLHLAGNTSHWKMGDARQTKVNLCGTRNMVNAALAKGARRFIHTSSIAAYGFQPGVIDEKCRSTAMDSPINYFRTKKQAEDEVHQGISLGLDAVILNPANIIGPWDFSGWSRFFFLIQNDNLPGVPGGSASFCHVREVARAHILAWKKGRTGENYLLGGADAAWPEFCEMIGEILNRKTPKRATPTVLLKALGRVSLWKSYLTRKEPDLTPEKALLVTSPLVCDSSKAIEELGYRPSELRTMLRDCHDWLLEEGLLKPSP